MKKYQQPNIKVTVLETEQILAASMGTHNQVGNRLQQGKEGFYYEEEEEYYTAPSTESVWN
ncbi:LysR family transcriptional regulator [Prevotella buccae]|jgi:hypothetical protein|uniref:LysR family transcriptional regulator n=1 Tax=Segatella buccae TaxID=28126 RepID=UPI001C5EAF6C|nr:LysR family transcriptional regulator [Segatella buccae]MBW4870853.1 LysR family transcriptional regulator [Segatella buccae]